MHTPSAQEPALHSSIACTCQAGSRLMHRTGLTPFPGPRYHCRILKLLKLAFLHRTGL